MVCEVLRTGGDTPDPGEPHTPLSAEQTWWDLHT